MGVSKTTGKLQCVASIVKMLLLAQLQKSMFQIFPQETVFFWSRKTYYDGKIAADQEYAYSLKVSLR